MREMSRRDRIAIGALENAIEHEPALRPVLVQDYARARRDFVTLRDSLERRLAAVSRHPDEPGSRSALVYRDGLAPYGTPDITGFGDGCVF